MGKKYLIMLDVDGTLIDSNYLSNSSTIYNLIDQLQNEGYVFVLNSNRSLEDLKSIARKFKIIGPLIGEGGTFIYNNNEEIKLVSEETEMQIKELRRMLPEIVCENFPSSHFIIDDTTSFNKALTSQDHPSQTKNIFILNKYRRFSLSCHVKKVINNKLEKNLESVVKLYGILRKYIEKQQMDIDISYTTKYANILISPKNCNKGKSFNKLSESYKNYTKIIIADDYFDKPMIQGIDYFFVVNNADEKAKEIANYISIEKITKGVEEILLNINNLTK